MFWVILSLAALLALIVLTLRHWHFVRRQQRIEQIVSDIAEERNPKAFAFYESQRFMRLGLSLEKISTTQQTLKQQIEQERFNLRAILSSMVEGVLVVRADHSIQLANTSLTSLFQLRENPTGKSLLTALRESAIDRLVEATLTTTKPQSSEIVLFRATEASSTETLHLTANAVAIEDANGKLRGAVVVLHDISRLRQLEEVRREFVANLSHELRTPLSLIQGYLENLIEEPEMPRDQAAQALQVMQRHARRLNALLEDLLTLSRLESRRDVMDFEPVTLRTFIEELLNDWKLKLRAKNLTALQDISLDLPPLRADRHRLQQVFNNLLDNAIRYSTPGSAITLAANADDTHIHVRVEDCGTGIPAKDLPHIFERFYRVEKARSREAGGTGLGLSIVKHIVAAHGGTISVESILGKGTAFTFHFPRQPQV